ncbi:hypothetical protein KP509_04G104500 [Ceratopteris richardii]|uniref:t-SNARE coiled-coil homology domain-containing protein n=2 Tax=Ceratopteris richardii TaxID=49495 RepID=A0A8T2UYT1_CERRI|nr:hypothetical protein KP509_04G104500 [Ceratopteris richardii]
MATRNRTQIFRKYRDALREVRLSSSSGIPQSSSSGGGPVIEMSTAPFLNQKAGYNAVSTVDVDNPRAGDVVISLPPQWVDISEEVSNNMQQARIKMNELIKAHAKALRPTFGDNKDDQRTIELLTHEITRLLKKCEKSLLQLSAGNGVNEDAKLRKNVQRLLATNLQSLSMEFRKQQKGYLERLQRQQDIPLAADLGMDLNERRTSSFEDDDDLGFGKQHISRVKKTEKLALQREKEISQIVESVNDLAQIMKDLSVLVIDQGTIVDRIDYNIQNVASSVEQGVKQLERAERTQKKGGMVLCVMILICLCLFMMFVLMIKWLLF